MILTQRSITFAPDDYKYPSWLSPQSFPTVKPTVQIQYSEITTAALCGTSWEQLEQYYTIDADSLKQYLMLPYSKAQAQLQINILDVMVEAAVEEKNTVLLKWLSTQWLGMSEKTVPQNANDVPVSEETVNQKLAALLEKRGATELRGALRIVGDNAPVQSTTVKANSQ